MTLPSVITTILPTYKRPEQFKKAIASVLAQTYPHFQLCVYDNASDDETREIVSRFSDPRVHYHCHSENIGSEANFQYGISQVRTPYFSILADDDQLLPEFYETALQGFEKYPDAAFSVTRVDEIDVEGNLVCSPLLNWPDSEYFSSPDGLLTMIGSYSNWTGIVFKTEVAQAIGAIDPSLKAVDVDYVFRIAARYPFAVSKKLGALFFQHPGSYSTANGLKLLVPGWQIMIDKLKKEEALSKEAKNQIEQRLIKDLHFQLFSLTIRLIEKNGLEAAAQAAEALSRQPGKQREGKAMSSLVRACTFFPFLQRLIAWMMKVRRKRRRNRLRYLTGKGEAN